MLPPEIVDHIFSFLDADPITLLKCIQCSSELCEIIERHLHTNITVGDAESDPQILNLITQTSSAKPSYCQLCSEPYHKGLSTIERLGP